MRPLFTSREEWRELRPAGRRAYLRAAVGHTLRAGVLGVGMLVVVCGVTEPHWRSPAVVAVLVASLLGGGATAYALFRREWQAAEKTYGAGA